MKVCTNCGAKPVGADWHCVKCQFKPEFHDRIPLLAPSINRAAIGYSEDHHVLLDRGEHDHFWFKARAKLILWSLNRYGEKLGSFLEIGCGTGFVLSEIERSHGAAEIVGSEIFLSALSHARTKLPAAELIQMDACNIPFIEHFSAIGAFDVIEHIVDDELVLKQCWHALEPGGLLILTVPQHQSLWSSYDEKAGHVRRYERKDLRLKLENQGFEVVRLTSFVSLLMPAMWAQRKVSGEKRDYDIEQEFKINRLANRVLEAVMSMERGLIRLGVSFSKGGSLLAVAKRPIG